MVQLRGLSLAWWPRAIHNSWVYQVAFLNGVLSEKFPWLNRERLVEMHERPLK